jgi:hypothetical protein
MSVGGAHAHGRAKRGPVRTFWLYASLREAKAIDEGPHGIALVQLQQTSVWRSNNGVRAANPFRLAGNQVGREAPSWPLP